ncbi:hypothetical protein ONA24_01820 [Mycoplasmopsis cynos]|uniref:Uncharacterized protein n=1 Tax=Mycoplasmopsis cynos (strain C142) TaxID=1246955 RepID=L0RXQ3_MYCC1|nr:hypothetical protein [Mycoplasmopsis cynos]MCU9933007.1 hypothetical protein [Mycoplasmopsis cynos]UWV82656.1 hypothetical protein NW067_07040 [Mycoplasmopsis cynos]WAM03771.1 hypothetical protein ONA22_01915 [Mycoplasmopsis cynos]WAM06420.1 hypothetical protein ONA23_05585 [Mycoplasmopsis cynos]WAM10029.1 hypothetical protein ONA24_01820 [Mycoplasmopsis cynos]
MKFVNKTTIINKIKIVVFVILKRIKLFLIKIVYFAIQNQLKKWDRITQNWGQILNQLKIAFEEE